MPKKKAALPETPEWSHRIDAASVGASHPVKLKIKASAQETADLARRLGVKEMSLVDAEATLDRESANTVHVQGIVKARVIQSCVVTGEPVISVIEEPFEAWFEDQDQVVLLSRAKHERQARIMDAEVPMLDEKDAPDPLVEGKIDIGELATQFLSLAIDPYPHAKDVDFPVQTEWVSGNSSIPAVRRNPFEALREWKSNKKGGN